MQSYKEESPQPTSSILKSILKTVYVVHFIISLALATFIIAKFPQVVSGTVSFVMLVIYGYMGAWVLLIGFLLVLCKRHEKAVIFCRIFVKTVIIFFPIFGLLSISKDHQLDNKYIHIFIIYMGVASLLLIVYELITCFCYQDTHPEFLFQQNDLGQANEKVLGKRKQYNDLIRSL